MVRRTGAKCERRNQVSPKLSQDQCQPGGNLWLCSVISRQRASMASFTAVLPLTEVAPLSEW